MKVTLKNEEVKEFDSPLSVYEIAASLSAGLAKRRAPRRSMEPRRIFAPLSPATARSRF